MKRLVTKPLKAYFDWWNPRYKRQVAKQLALTCPADASVLDVGCDDGFVANTMMGFAPTLRFQGVDVQDLRPACIPRVKYDGQRLPFDDGSFDVVMAVDVLHHTTDITAMLVEMARVSRRFVLIKDHVVEGPISNWLVGVADWLSNVPYGIPCVYNYPTWDGWHDHYQQSRLTPVTIVKQFPLSFPASNRQNPIVLLQKCA